MLTVYYNIFDTVSPLNDIGKPIYKLKDYNINRVESVSIDFETLEVEDRFIVESKVFNLENFNFQPYTNDENNMVEYSFERTDCKNLVIDSTEIENNVIKFGCFSLQYTDEEEIYILFDKINKNYFSEDLESKFYSENLVDLLQYKTIIDPNRKEVKQLFYNVLSQYQNYSNHYDIYLFIDTRLDDWWWRTMLFSDFFSLQNKISSEVHLLIECKKRELEDINRIVTSSLVDTGLIVSDVVKFVIKLYV